MTSPPTRVTVRAPAKINLDLRVRGRRPDGHHELRTLFQSLELHDTISLRSRPGPFTVRSRSHGVPEDQANLIWTAAETLWRAARFDGPPGGVAVTLRKVVPTAAGLGGGSSDAAAAIRGLVALWRLNWPVGRLRRIAASVGADVPYFFQGGTAIGLGRGDLIRPVAPELGRCWVVLAMPRFGVTTADAYRWHDRHPGATDRPEPRGRDWSARLAACGNDLEPAVTRRHPELGVMVERLRHAGAHASAMTGSGSAVFGLFRRRDHARRARTAVRRSGWRTLLTCTTTHSEFARLTRPLACPSGALRLEYSFAL